MVFIFIFSHILSTIICACHVSRTCPWPRESSRTISIVLGLGLVDKVLKFTKDTYTSSADVLNVQKNCTTNSTNPMKYFRLLTM